MKPRRFHSTHVIASCLMQGDIFKMAGKKYVIVRNENNSFGNPVLVFQPLKRRRPAWVHTLIVDKNTRFKVYFQK